VTVSAGWRVWGPRLSQAGEFASGPPLKAIRFGIIATPGVSSCSLLPFLKSVTHQVGGSDEQTAVRLKSPGIIFGIGETLDLRQEHAAGVLVRVSDVVEVNKVAQRLVRDTTLDSSAVVTVELKAHLIGLRGETFGDNPKRHRKSLSLIGDSSTWGVMIPRGTDGRQKAR
jgi:hypothetical protein